jgi:hypothetical protein
MAMQIQVILRKQRYGGHFFDTYRATVSYGEFLPCDVSSVELRRHEDLAQQLAGALLNQVAPVDIEGAGLFAGETISRLHLRTIVENWDAVDFSGTPWHALAQQIDRELERREEKERQEEGRRPVQVSFAFDSPAQQSGSFTISSKVARWLGTQLLALADGDGSANGATIRVRNDLAIDDGSGTT